MGKQQEIIENILICRLCDKIGKHNYPKTSSINKLCATLKDDTTDKNEQKSERQNTYASAKSKELHPHAQSQRNA
ncbi:MAG TPA: hypothetical protein PLA16_11385, partial [Chitinophagales bacterium]|nr:hypothetical protein [Chitinophagales bacterium]